MKKAAARAAFVLIPAVLLVAPCLLGHWVFALIVFGAMIHFGLEMTKPRPERGEK